MLRNILLMLGLLLAVWTAACSKAPTPPPDTRAADLQAVKEVEAASFKAVAAKDDNWINYFAEDACGLYPGAGILCGKAAIKTSMASFFADPNFSVTFQCTRAMASKGGDMVFSQGTYTLTMTNPKTKKPMTDKGKYLTVYMKQADGSWKAVADTYNSDSPM
jgi:uncharacterized protein (TIGR02246 family)